MQKTFSTLCLSLAISCGSVTLSILPSTSFAAAINFQQILQQERAWAGLQSKQVKVENVMWSYSEGGSSAKPTVLLIHGLAGSRDNWNRVARYLTPYYHVIIPDLPAHGDTQVTEDFDLTIPNLTEKIRRFVEAGKFENQLHIAGHSMGGAIALLYTAQYPLETQSLLLVDSAGIYKTANTAYLKDPTLLKDLMVSKAGDFDKLMRLTTETPPFIPNEIKIEQEKMMIAQSKNTQKMINQLVLMSKTHTPDSFALAARTIDVPTLIIWGKQDKIINVEAAQELKSLLKKAETPIVLDGVGHMPILEAEQLMVKPYLEFLKK